MTTITFIIGSQYNCEFSRKESIIYFAVKTAHILFVIGWMACVFVLPRAILHYKYSQESGKDIDTIKLLSVKLFRFGLLMFFLALLFGAWLWLGFSIGGTWLSIKLGLVALLLVYFLISGWLLFRAVKHNSFLGNITLRVFNESSLLLAIPIIYLAVSKNA